MEFKIIDLAIRVRKVLRSVKIKIRKIISTKDHIELTFNYSKNCTSHINLQLNLKQQSKNYNFFN